MQEPARSGAPMAIDYENEIDLRELFAVLWAGRKLLVGITSVFVLVAVVVALITPINIKPPRLLHRRIVVAVRCWVPWHHSLAV